MPFYDVIIIGGGVVGCMTARALSRYQLDILLIEAASDVGTGASAANTAIVHPGYDPPPGSLKASLNVQGNRMWDELAGQLHFDFERPGDYVVAVGEEELPVLERLLEQGRRNGVPGMQMISADEMRRREPNINPNVSGALCASTGGICDPFGVTIAAAENAVDNGVTLLLETRFLDFRMDGKRITGVRTSGGDFGCRWVVNAAGLYADEVMHKTGLHPEFKITPRRGEYYIFDRNEITINNVLFPVPTKAGKGILVTTTVHGNTIAGPNAENIEDKEERSVSAAGLQEVAAGAKKLVPGLEMRFTIALFAGLRAGGNAPSPNKALSYNADFLVEIPTEVHGLVNLAGIESPGLTASPAIAAMAVDLLRDAGEKLVEKPGWNPERPARPRFRHLYPRQQADLVRQDPAYGRIICRCENVTEGEILAELGGPIPIKTYDAIKRRTWLGTGRCQGGFDMPRLTAILSRELAMSPLEVTKKGSASALLRRTTKGMEE